LASKSGVKGKRSLNLALHEELITEFKAVLNQGERRDSAAQWKRKEKEWATSSPRELKGGNKKNISSNEPKTVQGSKFITKGRANFSRKF